MICPNDFTIHGHTDEGEQKLILRYSFKRKEFTYRIGDHYVTEMTGDDYDFDKDMLDSIL